MQLSQFLVALKQKNQKGFIQTLKDQSNQQNEFFKALDKIQPIEPIKRCVDNKLFDVVQQSQNKKNNLNWSQIWPTPDYGWTNSHLTDQEIIHFETIEFLFRSPWSKRPEDWLIIKERKMINTESIAGFVMIVGTPSIPEMFVVKSPKIKDKNGNETDSFIGELRFEYFVGKIVCNQIRKHFLPNFPYYFGLLECSSIDAPSKIDEWCELGLEPQLVMENIRDSIIFGKWFIHQSISEIINLLAQLFNASLHAFLNYGFSHNDLHLANLMIREAPSPWKIKLESDLGYLEIKQVGVIIDMGKATFRYKDQLASVPLKFDPIFPNSAGYSRPVNDLIKFIVLIYHFLLFNQQNSNSISLMFNVEELKSVLDKIYLIFQQLIQKENHSVVFHPNLTSFVENGKASWWNLPIEDSHHTFENEIFLTQFVTQTFQNVFSVYLGNKWDKSSCDANSSLIDEKFKSWLITNQLGSPMTTNESPPKKRKIDSLKSFDDQNNLLIDIFEEHPFTPSEPISVEENFSFLKSMFNFDPTAIF